MSLLDDVSIVVTPNGYKAGELYAVVPVPTEGAEEVTNGDFATDSDWTKETGWTISGGTANYSGGTSNRNIRQAIGITNGKTYKIQYQVTAITAGEVACRFGGMSGVDEITATTTGTYVGYITANSSVNGELLFEDNDNNFVGSIDNVSVKEYTAADMDVTRATAGTRVDENGLVNYAEIIGSEEVTDGDFSNGFDDWQVGSAWSVNNNVATVLNGSTTANSVFKQDSCVLDSSKMYVLEYTITNYITGFLVMNLGFVSIPSTNGTHKFYFTGQTTLYLKRGGNVSLSISNISVKEVTRDNVPRIDYTGGGCPHILAEPQRTNLITDSEELSATTNVTLSNTISPDGTLSGLKINETTSNSQHYSTSYGASVVSGGTIYTVSFYIKKGAYDVVKVYTQSSRISVSINITFSTESTNTSGSDFVSGSNFMEDAGNGWYRVGFSATANTTGEVSLYLPPKDLSTYAGDISQYTEYWGIQIEEGSYATSYIPTSGSTVTRNQDIFTRDGIGSLINDSEGVLFVEFKTLYETGSFRQFNLFKDTSNRIYITKRGDNGSLECRMENPSGSLNFSFTQNTTNDFVKVAFRYGLNNFAVFIDGVNKNVTSTGNVFASGTLNTLEFDSPLGQTFYGKVKQLQVYNTALTDEQLLQLTGESGTDFYESYAEMAAALTYTIQ